MMEELSWPILFYFHSGLWLKISHLTIVPSCRVRERKETGRESSQIIKRINFRLLCACHYFKFSKVVFYHEIVATGSQTSEIYQFTSISQRFWKWRICFG